MGQRKLQSFYHQILYWRWRRDAAPIVRRNAPRLEDAPLGKGLAQLSLLLVDGGRGYHLAQLRYVTTGMDDITSATLPRPL